MQDRVSQYPGRVKLTPVSGQENVYDMEWADGATVAGTPLNKANLLTDATATAMGLTSSATPNTALAQLNTKINNNKANADSRFSNMNWAQIGVANISLSFDSDSRMHYFDIALSTPITSLTDLMVSSDLIVVGNSVSIYILKSSGGGETNFAVSINSNNGAFWAQFSLPRTSSQKQENISLVNGNPYFYPGSTLYMTNRSLDGLAEINKLCLRADLADRNNTVTGTIYVHGRRLP